MLLLPSSCSEKIGPFRLCYQQNDASFCCLCRNVHLHPSREHKSPFLTVSPATFISLHKWRENCFCPLQLHHHQHPSLRYFYFHPPKRSSHGTGRQCSVPITPRWSMGPAVLQEKVVPEHTCSVAFLHSSPSASIPCSLCCCISCIMSMCNVHPSIMWMKLFIFELQEYQRKYLLSKVVLISV